MHSHGSSELAAARVPQQKDKNASSDDTLRTHIAKPCHELYTAPSSAIPLAPSRVGITRINLHTCDSSHAFGKSVCLQLFGSNHPNLLPIDRGLQDDWILWVHDLEALQLVYLGKAGNGCIDKSLFTRTRKVLDR